MLCCVRMSTVQMCAAELFKLTENRDVPGRQGVLCSNKAQPVRLGVRIRITATTRASVARMVAAITARREPGAEERR